MKFTKLAILTTAAMLALCVSSAKAAPGTTTRNSKLNVSLTVVTNLVEVFNTNNGAWSRSIQSFKIGNKQLLDLFALWNESSRTNEPWKSAQLVIGWDWNYDVLVVDKTGSNVLYDASSNFPEGDNYFYVNFWGDWEDSYFGVGNESGVDAPHGNYSVIDAGTAYFELYDDYYYLPYTDIWGYGGNMQTFKQTWNNSSANWSDSENAIFSFNGGQYYLDGSPRTTSYGTITANGSGTGYNGIGWANYPE
jgi:hypothetical protein